MKLWFVAFTVVVICARSAMAQVATPKRVDVSAAGESQVVEALELRLRALLREYPVQVHWAHVAEIRPREVFADQSDALAKIWLDARGSSRAVLYVVDSARERFLVRVVPLESGYDEVASESLGTIVQSSVDALLAGASVGVTRQAAEAQVQELEPKPAAPTKPATRHAPTPPRIVAAPRNARVRTTALDASYHLRVLSQSPTILHGPELGVALGRARVEQAAPTLRLALSHHLPSEWSRDGVGVRFTGAGARVALGYKLRLGTQWTWSPSVGVGVDWLHVDPQVSTQTSSERPDFELFTPLFGANVELQRVWSNWAVWCSVGIERDVLGNHFDVVRDGEPHTVLAPWVVSPVLRLGVRWWP